MINSANLVSVPVDQTVSREESPRAAASHIQDGWMIVSEVLNFSVRVVSTRLGDAEIVNKSEKRTLFRTDTFASFSLSLLVYLSKSF